MRITKFLAAITVIISPLIIAPLKFYPLAIVSRLLGIVSNSSHFILTSTIRVAVPPKQSVVGFVSGLAEKYEIPHILARFTHSQRNFLIPFRATLNGRQLDGFVHFCFKNAHRHGTRLHNSNLGQREMKLYFPNGVSTPVGVVCQFRSRNFHTKALLFAKTLFFDTGRYLLRRDFGVAREEKIPKKNGSNLARVYLTAIFLSFGYLYSLTFFVFFTLESDIEESKIQSCHY